MMEEMPCVSSGRGKFQLPSSPKSLSPAFPFMGWRGLLFPLKNKNILS